MRSLKAARHELRCRECRVTWKSWLQRLVGIAKGYTPTVPARSTSRRPKPVNRTLEEALDIIDGQFAEDRFTEGEDL